MKKLLLRALPTILRLMGDYLQTKDTPTHKAVGDALTKLAPAVEHVDESAKARSALMVTKMVIDEHLNK